MAETKMDMSDETLRKHPLRELLEMVGVILLCAVVCGLFWAVVGGICWALTSLTG